MPAWYQRPGYVRTMAKLVVEKVVQYSEEEMRQGLHVLFSAHGVPESYIIGECYNCECHAMPRDARATSAHTFRVLKPSFCWGGKQMLDVLIVY